MTAAVLLLVPAAGVVLSKIVPAVVIGAISVRFLLTGHFGLTGIDGFELAAGLTSPAVALLSLYVGLGLALEDSKRKVVLPLGRRDAGREALEGSPAEGSAAPSGMRGCDITSRCEPHEALLRRSLPGERIALDRADLRGAS